MVRVHWVVVKRENILNEGYAERRGGWTMMWGRVAEDVDVVVDEDVDVDVDEDVDTTESNKR